MPGLRSQKQIASRILKCGITRVRIDPARIADASEAITAQDIRKLISDGVVYEEPKKGNSGFRIRKNAAQKKKGRRRGRGSRKGNVRGKSKRQWIARIRAIRKLLVELKTEGRIDPKAYRDMYIKSKSGQFRSRSHVMIYLERNSLLKKGK
jgi:large subunit ribosomal protein L19e